MFLNCVPNHILTFRLGTVKYLRLRVRDAVEKWN